MEAAPELIAWLQRYYVASAAGDAAFLAAHVDPDANTLVIGTAPEEWWPGGAHIIDTWGTAWRTRGGLPVENSAPSAFRAGAVGWLADRADWRLPNGHRVPFRLSAVLIEHAGVWRLVQAHFSVGVPNAMLATWAAE